VDTPGIAKGVDVSGALAIVADDSTGLQVIDISNLSSPKIISSIDTPGDARDVVVNGSIAYVADYTGSLEIVDFTNPASPAIVGTTSQSVGGILMDVAQSGNFVFGADVFFVNSVPILEVTNPANPLGRGGINFGQFRDDNGTGLAVDGSYVYLTGTVSGGLENGATGDSRLYIGQYLALEDTHGIPPTVQITSPAAGDTVIEGTTIPITVTATDDVQVVSVNFVVDGRVVFTNLTAPYQFNFAVPAGVTSLTLGTSAIDPGGNVGLADDVRINVIPDPGTTVVGTVVDSLGNPVAGATVSTQGGRSGVTGSDGTFSISDVPTILGDIRVSATFTTSDGTVLTGTSEAVPAVRGGITDVGQIQVVACVAPPSGLVSWWPGDGNANDIIDANAGTLQNGAGFAPGKVGQAFSFDGVDDYVNIPDSPPLDSIASTITVDLWINPEIPPSGAGWAFARRDPFVSEGFSVSITSDGRLEIIVRTTTSPTVSGSVFKSGPGVITFGQFQHIAAIANTGTGLVKGFVNGQSVALSNTFGPSTLSGSLFNVNNLFIGRRQSSATSEGAGGGAHYKGLIDEVGIYSVELSQAQIQSIFNAGSSGKCKP
jgi:hypothetical protein